MTQDPLRKMVATAAIWLLGMFLLGPTSAMAEEDMNMALRAYDLANPTDRKTAEIVCKYTEWHMVGQFGFTL